MQTCVVAQENGRVTMRSQSIAVHRSPLQIVHAQTVDEHNHFAAVRSDFCHAVCIQNLALVVQCHLRRKRILAFFQSVTHHAIQCGQYRFALGRVGCFDDVSR